MQLLPLQAGLQKNPYREDLSPAHREEINPADAVSSLKQDCPAVRSLDHPIRNGSQVHKYEH